MDNLVEERVILKLDDGKRLLYIRAKTSTSHIYKIQKTIPLWSISISKLCASVLKLSSAEFIADLEEEMGRGLRAQKFCFRLSYDLLLSLVKWYTKQVENLYRDIASFHIKPSRKKDETEKGDVKKTKTKKRDPKGFDLASSMKDVFIDLRDYDKFMENIASLDDEAHLVTLSESLPPTLDGSDNIFQEAFDDAEIGDTLDDILKGMWSPSDPEGFKIPHPIIEEEGQGEVVGEQQSVSFVRHEVPSREGSFLRPASRKEEQKRRKPSDAPPRVVMVEEDIIAPFEVPSPALLQGKQPESPFIPPHESTRIYPERGALPILVTSPRPDQSPPATGPHQIQVEVDVHVPFDPEENVSAAQPPQDQSAGILPSSVWGDFEEIVAEPAVHESAFHPLAEPEVPVTVGEGMHVETEPEFHVAPEPEKQVMSESEIQTVLDPEVFVIPESKIQLPEILVHALLQDTHAEEGARYQQSATDQPPAADQPPVADQQPAADQQPVAEQLQDAAARKPRPRRRAGQNKVNKRSQISKKKIQKAYLEFPKKFNHVPTPYKVLNAFLQKQQKVDKEEETLMSLRQHEMFQIGSFDVCSPGCFFDEPDPEASREDEFLSVDFCFDSLDRTRLPRESMQESLLLAKQADRSAERRSGRRGVESPFIIQEPMVEEQQFEKLASPRLSFVPPSVPDISLHEEAVPTSELPEPMVTDTYQVDEQAFVELPSVVETDRQIPSPQAMPPPSEVPEPMQVDLPEVEQVEMYPRKSLSPGPAGRPTSEESEGRAAPDEPPIVCVYPIERLDFAPTRATKESLLKVLGNLWALVDEGVPFDVICKPAPANVKRPVISYPKSRSVSLRSTAAHCFSLLIEMQHEKLVKLEQGAPGKILIFPPQ